MSKEFRCFKCDHINVIGKETKPTLHQLQQAEIDDLKEKVDQGEAELKRLWGLLDDIDTAGDAFKPDQTPYFKYVDKKSCERHGLYTSDGYEIIRKGN